MGHCGEWYKALRFYFAGRTRCRYVFQRSQYRRPAIPLFLRHLWSGQLLCVQKTPSGFVPVGNLCLHPVLPPYNPVAAPGYLRPQALVDHIPHSSTHMQLHRCKRHNHRQDNRSHNSGFCILDVCSHRPVRRSEYPTDRLRRHHPDLRYYETAISCPDNRPPAGLPWCADNVSAH